MSKARDLADGTFDTDTLVVDAGNNRVGIGTATPETNLHVSSSSNGAVAIVEAEGAYNARLRILSGNANSSFLEFADPDDSDVGEIVYEHANNAMRFNTSGAERLRILSSGGITFNGDTAAANALDDYEEGTWTPNFSVDGWTQTISSTAGFYTKIGRVVTIQWDVLLINSGYMSSYSLIDNLPFTSYSSWSGVSGFYGNGNIGGNGIGSSGWINANNTLLYLYQSISSVTATGWRGTHTYFAA